MRHSFKTAICIALACACLTAVGASAAGCKSKAVSPIDLTPLSVYMANDWYLGTTTAQGDTVSDTFDLMQVFVTASDFAYSGDNLSIVGTTAVVTGSGQGVLTFRRDGADEALNVYVKDAVNVTTEAQLRKHLANSDSIVLQADIAAQGSDDICVKSDIYGNGHRFEAYSIVSKQDSCFYMDGPQIRIQDLHVIGKAVDPNDETVKLEDFEGFGALFNLDDAYYDGHSVLQNCIGENGHKIVVLRGIQITIEGCIFRNAADAIIASETTENNTGSQITLRNNVLANAVVAGFLFWGVGKANESSQQTLTIEGFLDIYNWKSSENAKLMPGTEAAAGLVNGLIPGELKKEEYAHYFYKDGGNKYVHFGLVTVWTGDMKCDNTPTIVGLDAVGIYKKDFPLPPAAGIVVRRCDLYGYDSAGTPPIKPTDKITDNPDLYQELRNGRAA